jgi:hypothetical protein
MERGAYDHKTRLTVMKLIGKANVCETRVPEVWGIMADHFGISLPGRVRAHSVRVKDKDGNVQTKRVEHFKPWMPSVSTCVNIRCEMGRRRRRVIAAV